MKDLICRHFEEENKLLIEEMADLKLEDNKSLDLLSNGKVVGKIIVIP